MVVKYELAGVGIKFLLVLAYGHFGAVLSGSVIVVEILRLMWVVMVEYEAVIRKVICFEFQASLYAGCTDRASCVSLLLLAGHLCNP